MDYAYAVYELFFDGAHQHRTVMEPLYARQARAEAVAEHLDLVSDQDYSYVVEEIKVDNSTN